MNKVAKPRENRISEIFVTDIKKVDSSRFRLTYPQRGGGAESINVFKRSGGRIINCASVKRGGGGTVSTSGQFHSLITKGSAQKTQQKPSFARGRGPATGPKKMEDLPSTGKTSEFPGKGKERKDIGLRG